MNAKDEKYLKAYPNQDEFYFTADGLAFFDKKEAEIHAATLRGKKEIRELHRSKNKSTNTK